MSATMKQDRPASEAGGHIVAKPSDNWFDLSELAAKLERLPVGEGSPDYFLRLEMDEAAFVSSVATASARDQVQVQGWVQSADPAPEGKIALETYQSANSARDIARRVSVWFDEETMRSTHKPLRDHTEAPRVYGLQQPNTEAVLSKLVAGIDLADRTRMQNTMALCLSKASQMRLRSEQSLFSGNGTAVFHALADHLVTRSENPWSEAQAAAFARGQMEEAGQNPTDQSARMLTDLGQALCDGEDDAAAVLLSGAVRSTEDYSSDDAEGHPEMNRHILGQVRQDMALATRAGNAITPAAVALGRMQGAAYLPAHSMASDPSITRDNAQDVLDQIKRSLPFDTRADGSTPTLQVAQSLKAIERAFQASADAVGRPGESLLRDNKAIFLRLSNENVSPDKGIVGYASKIKLEDDTSRQAISSSARAGRSFIHELGHAVNTSWGFSEADRDACLQASGVTAAMHDEIDRRFPADAIEQRSYYRDSRELFARTFDAHVCNVARDAGDTDLASIGGMHTTSGFDVGCPHGNLEATSLFMDQVRATIDHKLEAANTAQIEQKRQAAPKGASGGLSR